jgi:hypothetical protein
MSTECGYTVSCFCTFSSQKGLIDEALQMLQWAIELNPGYTQAQIYLASVVGDLDAEAEKRKCPML